MSSAIDWLMSLLHGHPGWYDPICSHCGKRHAGHRLTDAREYVSYYEYCPVRHAEWLASAGEGSGGDGA